MHITELSDWRGRLDKLAEIAANYLRRGDRTNATVPSIRVIRDYIDRGIISPPRRRGSQDTYYRYRHILELVGARLLIADGWPLAKIAEHFRHITDAELVNLLEGERSSAEAGFSENDDPQSGFRVGLIASLPNPPPLQPTEKTHSTAARFGERALHLAAVRSELEMVRRRLDLSEDPATTQRLTMFTLAPWCRLLVDNIKLSHMSIEDAELIGRAVAATLVESGTRKGDPTR